MKDKSKAKAQQQLLISKKNLCLQWLSQLPMNRFKLILQILQAEVKEMRSLRIVTLLMNLWTILQRLSRQI
jgi:hypothetical protein